MIDKYYKARKLAWWLFEHILIPILVVLIAFFIYHVIIINIIFRGLQ